MAAEASEGVGPSGRAQVDATQSRREVDRLPVRPAAPPAVLRTEQVAEQLVAHDEERVDPEDATVERLLGECRVLDQLTGIARVEHPVEVLAAPEVDGFLELRQQDGVVRNRRLVGGEGRAPRRLRLPAVPRVRLDQQRAERCRRDDAERRGAPLPAVHPMPTIPRNRVVRP